MSTSPNLSRSYPLHAAEEDIRRISKPFRFFAPPLVDRISPHLFHSHYFSRSYKVALLKTWSIDPIQLSVGCVEPKTLI